MESGGRRARRVRKDDSLVTDFLDLRDSSIVQTGPKRPRREGTVTHRELLTPLDRPRTRTGQRSTRRRKDTPRTELAETVRELLEAATDVSELVSPASKHAPLTPTPRRHTTAEPTSSPIVDESPPTESSRVLRSALKGVRTLSSLRKKDPRSDTRVSFGDYVTVTEYSLDSSREVASGSGETLSGDHTHLPVQLEDESSDEEPEEEESDEELETRPEQPAKKTSQTPEHSQFRPVRKVKPSPERTRMRRNAPQQPKRKQKVKTLSRSLIKNLFMLSSKKRVTKDAMDLVMKFADVYLRQASEDVAVYSSHASRRTIEVQDVVLLLKRQRFITEKQSFEYLVNTHLPLEYVEELLPCAQAGRKIIPKNTFT